MLIIQSWKYKSYTLSFKSLKIYEIFTYIATPCIELIEYFQLKGVKSVECLLKTILNLI